MCCPRVGLGPPLHIVLAFLVLSHSLLCCFFYSSFLLPTVCVCCHSIVGLVLCLCDRVVSLWNGGGGLCWVEGVCGVYCLLRILIIRVVVCGLWNGGV